MDPKKIEVMQDWPCPKTYENITWFLRVHRLLPKILKIVDKLQLP
jgi:hypothetical protein